MFRGLSLGGVGAAALASVAFVSVALAAVESVLAGIQINGFDFDSFSH